MSSVKILAADSRPLTMKLMEMHVKGFAPEKKIIGSTVDLIRAQYVVDIFQELVTPNYGLNI